MDANLFSNDYIDIKHPRFIIDLMYAHEANMTGQNIYEQIGFGNKAYVHINLWEKLKDLIPYLEETNQYLKVFDAYRPPLAHKKMLEIIPIPNFFASKPELSLHCRAIAIDVCLCDKNKKEYDYPTKVDAYTPYFATQVQNGNAKEFEEHLKKASHNYESEKFSTEIQNRKELKKQMEKIGLKAIAHEWWHYNLVDKELRDNFPLVSFGN